MKKIVSIIMLICLFCTASSATPLYANEWESLHSDDNLTMTIYDRTLDQYFAQRENLYMSEKSEFDPERWEFIQDWKALLGGITFRSAAVEHSVTEVMSATATEARLRVYEYISLVYVCNGYDVERDMKFGLDHIIRLEKGSDGYEIVSDSYAEPVGYEVGLAEDLAVFEAERAALINEEEVHAMQQPMSSTAGNYTVNENYDPQAAINYSYLWNAANSGPSGYNREYYYYSGVDCCNFVSQCIHEGGMTMDSVWRTTKANASTPMTDDTENPAYSSVAWVNTVSFRNYWVNTKHYYSTQVTSISQAIPGNTLFWLNADPGEESNHNMLIVDVDENGNIYVNAHTSNVQEFAWSLNQQNDAKTGTRKFYTIDFAHNFVCSSQNSSTHTCTLCGVAVSHDLQWKEVASAPYYHALHCSVCDYVGERGYHNEDGEIIDEGDLHILTCSKCGMEGSSHEPRYWYGDCEYCP